MFKSILNFLYNDTNIGIIVGIICFICGWIAGDILFNSMYPVQYNTEASGVLSNYGYVQVENGI